MAMNVRTSMVAATNSGFDGASVNKALTDAVKDLSKNSSVRDADEVVLSEAATGLMRSAQQTGTQGSNASLPMINNRDPGMTV